jgi:hypothetical protein
MRGYADVRLRRMMCGYADAEMRRMMCEWEERCGDDLMILLMGLKQL